MKTDFSGYEGALRFLRWAEGKTPAQIRLAVYGRPKRMTARDFVDRAVGDLLNAVGDLRAAERLGVDVSRIRLDLDGEAMRLMSLLNSMPTPKPRKAKR